MAAVEPADLDYCYVTTTGRRSGNPHTIEIWFALHEGRVYLLSGGAEVSSRSCADEVEARTFASVVRQHIEWLSEPVFRRYYAIAEGS